jgi:hypothetical protein
MTNIKELEKLGYILENVQNRIIRIKNGYNDTICSVFIQSGYSVIENGKIFNHFAEVKEGIKNESNFLKL